MKHESSRIFGMTHVWGSLCMCLLIMCLTTFSFFLDEKVAKNQGCIQFLTLFERLAA